MSIGATSDTEGIVLFLFVTVLALIIVELGLVVVIVNPAVVELIPGVAAVVVLVVALVVGLEQNTGHNPKCFTNLLSSIIFRASQKILQNIFELFWNLLANNFGFGTSSK